MANTNAPAGLVPVRNKSGELRTAYYYIPASYGTALFKGDPVLVTGTTNTVNITTNGLLTIAGTLSEVNKAAAGAGNSSSGVIIDFLPNFDNTSRTHNPASTEAIAIVAIDKDQVYEIQEETAGTPLAATDSRSNGNMVFAESGSTITGLSGVELNTTVATTQNFQLRILNLVDRVDNAFGQHAKWLVQFNQHADAQNTAGV